MSYQISKFKINYYKIHVRKIYTDSPCLIKINKIINITLHTDVLYIYMNFNNKSELCIVSHVIMVNNRLKKQYITNIYIFYQQVKYLSCFIYLLNVLFKPCAILTSHYNKQIKQYCLLELLVKLCATCTSLLHIQLPYFMQLIYLPGTITNLGAIFMSHTYLFSIMLIILFFNLEYMYCNYICRSLQLTNIMCAVQLKTLLLIKYYNTR